jgi:hypothetical protein
MSTPAHAAVRSPDEAAARAMATLGTVAALARDLGVRTEVELPRLPGVVERTRALADALGLAATIDVQADGIRIRFAP